MFTKRYKSVLGPARLIRRESAGALLDVDVVKLAREAGPVFSPTFDALETADCYGLLADLPGVRQEDLEVTWTADRIRIAGRREPEALGEGADFYALERTFGRFARSFRLPAGACVDRTSAVLKDGVLTVLVPKPSMSLPLWSQPELTRVCPPKVDHLG